MCASRPSTPLDDEGVPKMDKPIASWWSVAAAGAVWLVVSMLSVSGCTAPRTATQPAAGARPAAAAPASAAPVVASASVQAAAPPVAATSAPAAPPPPIMPFNKAVLYAADALFKSANLETVAASSGGARLPMVIDPLVDGSSGAQSVATESMEGLVAELVRLQYPSLDLQPFSAATLARGPLLFIGTFTAVNMDGSNKPGRDWYRVCLALLDLRSGKIVSKGFGRAALEGVDPTPTQFFLDSPAWAPDPAVTGYITSCQGTRAGDPIKPAYYDRLMAAATINDAILAYNRRDYEEAYDLYDAVLRQPGGDQLRAYQGLYLAASKLDRKEVARQAFARIVDHGLAQKKLGVKFLFRPGSTLFPRDPQIAGAYPMWLAQLSERAGSDAACLEIGGHTSRTGPEPLNERLSLMRAQYIKQRLDAYVPALASRTRAAGKGSSENISGLGTDDARDALDRRVEFKVQDCAAMQQDATK